MTFIPVDLRRPLMIFVSFVLAIGVLALVFKAGTIVGYHQAMFSYRWGENYHRNFGGPPHGFFQNMDGEAATPSHGAFGRVLTVDGNQLTIKSDDGKESVILLMDNTVLLRGRDTVTRDALTSSTHVVVIGTPDDEGRTRASLIRLFPN